MTRTTKAATRQMDPVYSTPDFQALACSGGSQRAGTGARLVDHGHRCTKARPEHRMYADHIVELRDGGAPFDLK